jgi:hypothetical protein
LDWFFASEIGTDPVGAGIDRHPAVAVSLPVGIVWVDLERVAWIDRGSFCCELIGELRHCELKTEN